MPDSRYDFLVQYFKPARYSLTFLVYIKFIVLSKQLDRIIFSKVPAYLNIVDIAGLVKGASEGQGLGNSFLSHIRACDAIFHVSRAFVDEEVTHVEGDVDPVRDLDIIFDELRLKDLEYLNKQIEGMERSVLRAADKAKKASYVSSFTFYKILVELLVILCVFFSGNSPQSSYSSGRRQETGSFWNLG